MAQEIAAVLLSLALWVIPHMASAADRLVGVHSARVMSQSLPWIAEQAGLFRKYDVEFRLVYIGSSPLATAAMLGGDGELLMDGGLGIVRAYVQGNTELVCIGGQKNILTQSILAKPPIKRLEIYAVRKSASPASAARRIILPPKPSAESAWKRDATTL